MRLPLIILFIILVQITFVTAQQTINCNDQTTVNILNLPDSCLSLDSSITLDGLPVGGSFYGNGIINKKFNPLRLNTNNYTVTYVYVDSIGCSYTDCRNIKVTRIKATITKPDSEAFTPNGDSINDIFKINCKNYNSIKLQIFNRWGNIVFSSTNKSYWDGISNSGSTSGHLEPQGTYYWLIEITEYNGEKSTYNGYIYLQT